MWWSIYFDWVIKLVIVIVQFLTLRTIGMYVNQRAENSQETYTDHFKVLVSSYRDLL